MLFRQSGDILPDLVTLPFVLKSKEISQQNLTDDMFWEAIWEAIYDDSLIDFERIFPLSRVTSIPYFEAGKFNKTLLSLTYVDIGQTLWLSWQSARFWY